MRLSLITERLRIRFAALFVPEPNTGCWLWLGPIHSGGYGVISVRQAPGVQTTEFAHRVSYRLAVGPIPHGLNIDHLCRVRCCVNPGHLEPVPQVVNVRRGAVPILNAKMARAIFMDPRSSRKLASAMGIHHVTIHMVRARVTWSDATAGLAPPAKCKSGRPRSA